MNARKLARIAAARAETVRLLFAAQAYAFDLQKPAQIAYYTAHIAALDARAAGSRTVECPRPDLAKWDTMRCES